MNASAFRDVLYTGGKRGMIMEANDMTRARDGDEESLARLLKDNYAFVMKYVWKMCGDEQLAYDVTQDTLIKAVQKIDQYRGTSKFSTWLIQIATHTYIDARRKQQRNEKLEQQEKERIQLQTTKQLPEEWYDVQEALWNLEEKYRIPVLLKHYYGFEYKEIAKMTKSRTGTVKSRVHYGMEKLRKELNEHG